MKAFSSTHKAAYTPLSAWIVCLLFMLPAATHAALRGPYYLNDQGTGDVKWYADTGNDKQEKFRLNNGYINGDYWKYYKTNGGTGTITREKPYIDFTVRIFRDPKDKFINTKDRKHYTASPKYAEVFISSNLGYLKVGEIWQNEWNENTSFYFKANGNAANAGTITVVGHSNPGQVQVHYYPSSEMLKKLKKFTMVVYRKEHFYDSGLFSDDWDHIYYTYEKEYKIDFKDQLKASADYYKPGQMLFTAEGTVSEFEQLQDYETRQFYKNTLEQSKVYSIRVENVATNRSVTSEMEFNLRGETTTKVIDLPDYEKSQKGYRCYYTLTDKSQVKTSEGYQAGWKIKSEATLQLYPLLYPKDMTVEFDQFKQTNTIIWYNANWTAGMDSKTRYLLYRRQAVDIDGTPAQSAKWMYIDEINASTAAGHLYKLKDNDISYRKFYTYRIEAVPSAWEENIYYMPESQTETLPTDAYITQTVGTAPFMTYNEMEQDVKVLDKIRVSWGYTRIPGTSGNVEFTIYRNRQSDGPDKWTKVADNISAPANPSPTRKPYYEDTDVESCELYSYKVTVSSADSTFESEPVQATLLDRSLVKFVETTKGKNETTVSLRWDAKQVGSTATHYVVERRYAQSRNENDWQQIYSVSGTDDNYAFDDETVEAGRYYHYRVSAYVPDCKFEQEAKRRQAAGLPVNLDEYTFSNSLTEVGFGLCKGIISGRVTFSTNTGVEGVRINLSRGDEGLSGQLQDFSKRIDTLTTGIRWTDKVANIRKLIAKDKPFTVQLWTMPETEQADVPLVTLPGMGTVTARLVPSQWSHVSIIVSNGKAQVIVNADTVNQTTQTLTTTELEGDSAAVVFGAGSFRGLIKDVRIWDGALSGAEIQNNHGRILNGRESGLRLYWPLDEGLQEVAFDISNTNGVGNNRHATLDPAITNSTILPSADQLCLYGLTDEKGNYTVRGIPFVGGGTSYTVIPSKGIHTFASTSHNVFVGKGSMAVAGINFTDISSFTYTGTVRYLNTTIPVDSVMFKIDGTPVMKDNNMVMTDSEGRYEISVPIGEHYIEAYRTGHKTCRFPAGQGTYEFLSEGTLNFSDSTLVNVAGRINGGIDSGQAPIGFKQTKNRIGQATITLALETERNNQFNMRLDELDGFVHITDSTAIPSQDDSIRSENWYSTTTPTEILIRTNLEHGEFSAMLPPLRYQVKSIRFDKHSRNNDILFFNENLPVIDARFKPAQSPDSMRFEGDKEARKYESWGRFVMNYRCEPQLTVLQDSMPEGAFGEKVFTDNTDKQKHSFIDLDKDGKFLGYKWSQYPMFNQNATYTMWIKAEEKYYAYNPETQQEECTTIPVTDGLVHIANEMSINSLVTDSTITYNGETYPENSVIKTATLEVGLNKEGIVGYRWTSGDPNIQGDHLRYLSISLIANNRSYNWPGPFKTDNLPGIILGSVLSGTNFVTKAPDQLEYVLRDPAGASSHSFWQQDSIVTHTTRTQNGGYHTGNTAIAVTAVTGAKLEKEVGNVTVVGLGVVSGISFATGINTDVSTEITPFQSAASGSGLYDTYHSITTSFSTRVQTPSDALHVGRMGDTFIGRAKNLYYGNGIYVYLKRGDDGTYSVDTREEIAAKMPDRSTWFVYTERYIVSTLIPNWQTIRNGLLEPVKTIPATAPEDGQIHYYTLLDPSDPSYGQPGTYERRCNGLKETDIRLDSISTLNKYISTWKYYLGQNEAAKVQATRAKKVKMINRSFSGGTSFTYTHTSDDTDATTTTHAWNAGIVTSFTKNFLVNGNGVVLTAADGETGEQGQSSTEDKTTKRVQVGYTLSDPNKYAALSINIYDDPTGMGGPIFLTQGGQTMCPYEPGTKVEYNEDYMGRELDAATIRIEKCDLQVENPTLADVLSGETAYFRLKLQNLSETQTASAYTLQLDPKSNLQGATLAVDGQWVASGSATFVLPYGTTEKTLALKQTDRSVTKNDFRLRLFSTNDAFNTYSEWRTLTASFIPTSAKVELATERNIINGPQAGTGLKVTLRNLDRQFDGLKGIRLQYRRQGTNNWTLEREWIMAAYKDQYPTDSVVPETGDITHTMRFATDGTYELRAQTFSLYGSTDVTRETDLKTIIHDTQGPKMLGAITPADGSINISNIGDMHIQFNQDIDTEAISREENINIVGFQNNTSNESETAGIPAVAMQLNQNRVNTQAGFNLADTDLAFDFMYYRQSDGEILSVGSQQNRLALGTSQGGRLYVMVNDTTYTSDELVAADQWHHIALNYRRTGLPQPQLTVGLASNAEASQRLAFLEKPVAAVNIKGNLTLGSTATTGRICRLSMWNADRPVTEAYAEKDILKAAYNPNIVGYWLMNEGHGTSMYDRARSRTLQVPESSWYLDTKNLAAHLDGSRPMQLGFASASLTAEDNYEAELWFKADNNDESNNNATLLSTTNNLSIGFRSGSLILTTYANSDLPNAIADTTILFYAGELTDGLWHHLSVSVQRGTSARFHIDGKLITTLDERALPALAGDYIYIGGQLSSTTSGPAFTRLFKGDIDEVRIGTTTRSSRAIADHRFLREEIPADSLLDGISIYYPMETTRRTAEGLIETVFDPTNKIKMRTHLPEDNSHLQQAVTAPPMMMTTTLLRLDDADFDFTCDKRNIYFSFPPRVYAKMHGNSYSFMLKNIKDNYGNPSNPISWNTSFDLRSFIWNEREKHIEKDVSETVSGKATLLKAGQTALTYEVKGAPAWFVVDNPSGTIHSTAFETDITFHISNTAPLGEHTVQLYVTDNNGISSTLPIYVNVTGNSPEWTPETGLYSSNMTVTAQLHINGHIAENVASLVGAFDAEGRCRGVANPEFIPTRNAFYVNMIIYGDAEDKLYFRVYDADRNITYSGVNILSDGVTSQLYLRFSSTGVIGSYVKPAIITAGRTVQQQLNLNKGWNWASVYVTPSGRGAVGTVLRNYTDCLTTVKSKTAVADLKTDSQGKKNWTGSLSTIIPGQMYCIRATEPTELTVQGELTNILAPISISSGWNWIGSTSHYSISTSEAFLSLNPQKGDVVKSKTAFAIYDGAGRWNGELTAIEPGVGYKYQASKPGQLVFPNVAGYSAKRRTTDAEQRTTDDELFDDPQDNRKVHMAQRKSAEADYADYADNMNVILSITAADQPVTDASIAAYIDATERGTTQAIDGLYYLTVAGNAGDIGKPLTLEIDRNGQLTTVTLTDVRYAGDLITGTSDAPYRIDIGDTSGIAVIQDSPAGQQPVVYDLSGRQLRSAAEPGIYIERNPAQTRGRTILRTAGTPARP